LGECKVSEIVNVYKTKEQNTVHAAVLWKKNCTQ